MSNTIQDVGETAHNDSLNIFQRIGAILDYINPASNNFFAYKLLELLGNLLKSLFIPSDTAINAWLTDLNTWLGQKFGILYFPEEIVIDFFNYFDSIEDSNTAIIHIPEFRLQFMGFNAVFLQEYTYDLYDLLDNQVFATIHSIYLFFTDVILWLGVGFMCYRLFTFVFGGSSYDGIEHTNIIISKNFRNRK